LLRKTADSDAAPNPEVLDVLILTRTGKNAAKRSFTKAPWNTTNSKIFNQVTIQIEQIVLPPNGKKMCDAYDGFRTNDVFIDLVR
jgi:hypothetical protein